MSKKLSPEYESLLALRTYLNRTDAKQLELMVQHETPLDEINKWVNNILTNKQIRNARTMSGDEALKEYKEYEHLLSEDEARWIKKFYCEMYDNGIYNIHEDFRILKTEEMLKESNRIRNKRKTEMFDACTRVELSENRYPVDAEEEYSWEQVYSCFGYEPALNFIIDECLEELKVNNFDDRLTLIRYYIKMNRLRLANNKDQRNPKRKP